MYLNKNSVKCNVLISNVKYSGVNCISIKLIGINISKY